MKHYTIYSKPACPFCDQAKALLSSKNLEFTEVNLDVGQLKEDGAKYITRDELIAKIPGARTMPQIFMTDEGAAMHIGGFTDLKRILHA